MKRYKKWRAPPDGNCFFHSIAYLVGSSAQKIRKLCADLVYARRFEEISGLTLQEWIFYELDMSIEKYVQAIQYRLWGGSIELRLLSDYYGTNIEVYTKESHQIAALTSVFMPNEKCAIKPLCLLYSNGNHYDALYVET